MRSCRREREKNPNKQNKNKQRYKGESCALVRGRSVYIYLLLSRVLTLWKNPSHGHRCRTEEADNWNERNLIANAFHKKTTQLLPAAGNQKIWK